MWSHIATIRFLTGDYAGAVESAERIQNLIVDTPGWKAAALGELGRLDEREAAIKDLQEAVGAVWAGPKTLFDAIEYPQMQGADTLIADKDYESDEFRCALKAKGIAPCIPAKRNWHRAIPFDKVLYKQRHKIENMFGRLKDWRRVSTRHDRGAHTFFSAICIAATVIFWL